MNVWIEFQSIASAPFSLPESLASERNEQRDYVNLDEFAADSEAVQQGDTDSGMQPWTDDIARHQYLSRRHGS